MSNYRWDIYGGGKECKKSNWGNEMNKSINLVSQKLNYYFYTQEYISLKFWQVRCCFVCQKDKLVYWRQILFFQNYTHEQ